MNKPFTPPSDRAAEVSGLLPSAPTDAAGGRTLERSPSDLRMDATAARARHNTAVAVALEERAAEIEAAWEADDAGMPSTEERLRQCRANIAMIAALPPRPQPSPEDILAARKRTDNALRSLIAPLLSDEELTAHSADQRKFNREHRA